VTIFQLTRMRWLALCGLYLQTLAQRAKGRRRSVPDTTRMSREFLVTAIAKTPEGKRLLGGRVP
jgi:hypothetical protein